MAYRTYTIITHKYGKFYRKIKQNTETNICSRIKNDLHSTGYVVSTIIETNLSIIFSITNNKHVIKIHKDRNRANNEILFYSKYSHPNIVKYYNSVNIGDYIGIELEQCIADFYDINSIPFTERQLSEITRAIASILQYLHDNNIVYLDLKIENILLSEEETIKLCDFEFCHIFENDDDRATYWRGTSEYASPEIYCRIPYRYEPDIWALGILVHLLGYKTFIFHGEKNEISEAVINYTGRELGNSIIDRFILFCLSPMNNRPKISDILAHPFLNIDVTDYSDSARAASISTSDSASASTAALTQNKK